MSMQIVKAEAFESIKDAEGKTTGKRSLGSATVEYELGDSAAQAIELFGDEVVHSKFKADCVVWLQSVVRAAIKASKDPQEAVNAVTPGVKQVGPRMSKTEKLIAGVQSGEFSEDQIKAIKAALREASA